MSEHDSHEDSAISALYRRMSHEEPSLQLDERVMKMAHRHVTRRTYRWWLPLSTAAVIVLAVSVVVLRQQLPPVELQGRVAKYEESPAASQPLPAAAPAESPAPAAPRKEMRALEKPQQESKSRVAEAAPSVEAKRSAEPPAEPVVASAPTLAADAENDKAELNQADVARRAAAPAVTTAEAKERAETPVGSTVGVLASKPADKSAEKKLADVTASAAAPPARAEHQPEEANEAPEAWLKRIEALRTKGEIEAAKRELAAFRKAYPKWQLSKELQALLPEPVK